MLYLLENSFQKSAISRQPTSLYLIQSWQAVAFVDSLTANSGFNCVARPLQQLPQR
jgi:hypothetical protein